MNKKHQSLETVHTHTHTIWNNLQIRFGGNFRLDLICEKIIEKLE